MIGDEQDQTCNQPECGQPAAARVSTPAGPFGNQVFAIVRPITSPLDLGIPMCLDCAHHAVDLLLMSNRPSTSARQEGPA